MRHLSAWLVCCFSLLAALAGRAQGPAYGDWQLHLSARRPQQLADAGSRLYVADESSFFVYDKELNTSRFLSRRDGLSDVGVRALAYDPASAQLLIAYANGNLDLLADGGAVRNITDLLRKQTQGAKQISQIQIYNGLAYVSSSLGVVVVDLARREVRDTYGAIGPGGSSVAAYATAVLHDTLWAATSAGILRGRLNPAVNLLDYHSWTLELPDPQNPTRAFGQLEAYQGHLVAGAFFVGVAYVAGVGAARSWRTVPGSYSPAVRRLHVSGGQLLVAADGVPLSRFDAPTGRLVAVLPTASTGPALDAVRGDDGTLYVASINQGLLRFAAGSTSGEAIRPNGPETALAFGLTADAATNTVDVFTGGYSGDNGLQLGLQNGFYEYSAGRWTNYTATTYPSPRDFPNLKELSHGARLGDTLYVASYANGLLEWRGPGQFRQFTYSPGATPLRSSLDPDASNLDYVRVTDVAADPNGRFLWLVNRHQRSNLSGLYRFQPGSGQWLRSTWVPGFENLDRVVVDGYGNPWATQSRKGGIGLVAYDVATQQPFTFTQASTTVASTGSGLPSNTVYALARDRKGAIWIGTSQGVAYVADPSPLSSGKQPLFVQPFAQSGNGRFPTLYSEVVRCIAVDGGNRKWFGTGNGLWLFSENADQALLHFTTANSPLPSNSIVDVAVNDKTGEVFVATDMGVVSYQGAATVTEGAPSCAEVFPNPVRPEFAGTVGIRGVANNAQVKITDVAGHLVYSTTAAGGTVTWNLTDTAGRRVRSGVYLVLSADAEGKNTCISKVAVLSN